MFSDNDLKKLQEVLSQWSFSRKKEQKCREKKEEDTPTNGGLSLNPSQLLVIAGLIGGVFNVDSFLVDREQTIQIVLVGSLKRPTPLEEMMANVGALPFEQVMKAILG